jgi:endoglucanase
MLRGVIGKKPIHLLTPDERTKAAKLDDLFIDIGAKDKEDALTKVSLGDYATFSPGMEMLNDHLVTTKATDNKVGVLIAAALQQELKDQTIAANLYSVSSVQEEIGLRGAITSAFGIDPQVGIAIDVTHATDYPTINKAKYGDIKCGEGPVIAVGANINPMVFTLLKEAADKAGVKYQIEAAPRGTGTDANAIQTTRAGVAAGLISIPCRYMHTQNEVVSLNDVEGAVKIIAQFVRMIDDSTDFIPSV